MKILAGEVRPGMVLEYKGKLWRVTKANFSRTSMTRAKMQVEMKDVVNGLKTQDSFLTSENVERAQLSNRDMQYLYDDGSALTFMDKENFEQVTLPYDLVGDQRVWLTENMDVSVEFHDSKPIGLTLPPTVIMEVIEADAVIKGQTATTSYKPAKVSNGENVQVPPFVAVGERIIINTVDGSYASRA